MSITLTELARRLGLSTTTVSNVLNGKGDRFSETTVLRVRDAAKEHGYRPNAIARAMRSGQFGSLALLVGSERERSFLPPPLLAGIARGTRQRGLHLGMEFIDLDSDGATTIPKLVRENAADGLLVNVQKGCPPAIAEAITGSGLPVGWINDAHRSPDLAPPDRAAGRTLTTELLQLGHRRIAFVNLYNTARGEHHASALERQSGYLTAMKQAKSKPLVVSNTSEDTVQASTWNQVLEPLLDRAQRPTAMICLTTLMASIAYRTAVGLGLQVPRDLSLIAFADDHPYWGSFLVDALLVPWEAIGERAVTLVSPTDGETATDLPPLAFRRIEYGTVAPPPDR